MTTKEIKQSIDSMKLHLSKREKMEHWVNFLLLLAWLSFIGFTSIYEPISNGKVPTLGMLIIGLFFLLLRHKLISSKLEVYKSTLSQEQFKKANQAAAILNKWVITSNRKDYFSAIKHIGWQWEGIKVTAILRNGKLYLNSMVNPSTHSNPFSFGWNKKNKSELIRQYQSILKGENVIENITKELKKSEEEFWKESEWNIKNIFKRIVGYGLSAPLIGFGAWLISLGELSAIGIGVLFIVLCSSYIYQDIQVILEKRKRKKSGYNNNA